MTSAELKVIVAIARETRSTKHARPGDLVVEISKWGIDPDAIGWLIAHGRAPYERDAPVGSPTREVWDIVPCSDAGGPTMRWENAEFVSLPDSIAELARDAFPVAAAKVRGAMAAAKVGSTCDRCGAPAPDLETMACADRAACERRHKGG